MALRFLASWLPIVMAAGISACAAPKLARAPIDPQALEAEREIQKRIAITTAHKRQLHIERVARPLWVENAADCGHRVRYSIWGRTARLEDFSDPLVRRLMGETYQVTEDLTFSLITPGGPLDVAGAKSGDRVVSINGYRPLIEDKRQVLRDAVAAGKPFSLGVARREGVMETPMELMVFPELICAYDIHYQEGSAINAFADGDAVHILAGMLRFTESDEELAVVLAHELGHNAQRHLDAQRSNATLGTMFDLLAAAYGVNTNGQFGKIGAQAYSQDFEAEADTWGIYAMARAGLDVSNVPYFWRRMAAEHPQSINGSYRASHPSPPERFIGLEHNVKEIQTLQSQGAPLLPVTKPGPSSQPYRPDDESPGVRPGQSYDDSATARVPRRR